MRAIDLTGERFGCLSVIGFHSNPGSRRHWTCICDCGAQRVVAGANLRNGHTRSCGCIKPAATRAALTTHGCSVGEGTPAYRSWLHMWRRCTNPKAHAYHHYGGRGIVVCERWKDFGSFLSDMGERPDGMTLDRIDVNGNYEPANCRWATWSTQARNRRRKGQH